MNSTLNNLSTEQQIIATINSNYVDSFNTNITLVTCFYNINRDKWKEYSRTVDKYFLNTKNVLNKKNPIVIFTTEEYQEKCIHIRKKTDINLIYTKIILIPFNELMHYDKFEIIKNIQESNICNIPNNSHNCPEFCIPEYVIVINNKINFLKQATEKNYFNSYIFQWIDFGLHPSMYNNNPNFFNEQYFNNINYKKNKIKIAGFMNNNPIGNKKSFYNTHKSTIAGTLIGGDYDSINQLYNLWITEFTNMINLKCCNQEQYILHIIMSEYIDLFDYSIINNWDDLCKIYCI
jgi:protein YibB